MLVTVALAKECFVFQLWRYFLQWIGLKKKCTTVQAMKLENTLLIKRHIKGLRPWPWK